MGRSQELQESGPSALSRLCIAPQCRKASGDKPCFNGDTIPSGPNGRCSRLEEQWRRRSQSGRATALPADPRTGYRPHRNMALSADGNAVAQTGQAEGRSWRDLDKFRDLPSSG